MSETLKKITYNTLEQFLEEVNANFAIIENSPLYKGIPGNSTVGSPGTPGIRGTQFFFIDYAKFNTNFPGQLQTASNIDLLFLNNKNSGSFETRQKLLDSLETLYLVNNDIIVLSNSMMLKYNSITDLFVDTNIAFNQQNNIASTLQAQIEEYVKYYVDNNVTINNLQEDVFEKISTHAKNYADNNLGLLTTNILPTSVYAPYIPGVTREGIPIDDHKYFGFGNQQVPSGYKSTIVFGSIRKYIELLMATISTSSPFAMTSDYAPGVGNIPSAIFLQDTENNGLMFGYKGKSNLSSFGSIYKDANGAIVIKSDSGVLPNEFSKLRIHKNKMMYDKLVEFNDALKVKTDFYFDGDIQSKWFRAGKLSRSGKSNDLFIGAGAANDSKIIFESKQFNFPYLSKYPGKNTLLVIDGDGFILNDYTLHTGKISSTEENVSTQIATGNIPTTENEVLTTKQYSPVLRTLNNIKQQLKDVYALDTTTYTTAEESATSQITNVPTVDTKIVTSKFVRFVTKKLNNISTHFGNFYKKTDFTDNTIPKITVATEFYITNPIDAKFNFGEFIKTIGNNKYLIVGKSATGSILDLISKKVMLSNYKSKVIVTDSEGEIRNDVNLDTRNYSNTANEYKVPNSPDASYTSIVEDATNADKKILSGTQFNIIAKVLNNIKERFKNTPNTATSCWDRYMHMPIGSIVLWDTANDIPPGWYRCTGQILPECYNINAGSYMNYMYTPNLSSSEITVNAYYGGGNNRGVYAIEREIIYIQKGIKTGENTKYGVSVNVLPYSS